MYSTEFNLVDNNGNIRATKQLLGHIQSKFSEIKASEKITYPWKITSNITKADFIITENTTQQEWRDFSEFCMRLQ